MNPVPTTDPSPTVTLEIEEAVSVDSGLSPHEIGCATSSEWYPLSSGQLAMWLTTQAGGSHGAYTVPGVYELSGDLDVDALRRAFEDLLGRHESLRTAIEVVDGEPRQRPVEGALLDWTYQVDEGDPQRLIENFVAREFDLAQGRLLHVLLVREREGRHMLVISAHHIAVDGWSLTVLIDQVATAYQAYVRGEQPGIEVPEIQYKDYATWQQRLLDGGAFDDSRSYWQERFQDGIAPLDLPTDRPRPASRSYRGETASRVFRRDALQALKALCQEEQVTLFAGLTAVLRVQILRYTGQRDIALGTSAMTRPVPELYEQIGCYINSIALRDTVEESVSFRELLRTVQSTLRGGLRHHEYPFDRVVRESGVTTDPNRNPLFDVMVMVDQAWGQPTEAVEGLRIRNLGATNGHSKMDLTFFFEETSTGLQASVEYSTELFDPDRIERLLEHFGVLLGDAVTRPDQSVESLALLGEDEREELLRGFNRTERSYELETPVPQLFEQQAARTPERTATVDEVGSMTFAELNSRANRLAWTLRETYGVGAGTLVALYLERSVELTVAVLAVLKAGGAYLPINTKDPLDRVEAVLDDSGSAVVLVGGEPAASAFKGRAVLDVTACAPSPRTDNPPPVAGPDDLAYCIYTSGSTGRPKGALIEHRAIVNRLRWMTDDLGLGADDVILQKTPYSFDVSVWELLLPGIIGAKQVMLRPDGESDPEVIRTTVERHGVTTLHFVPSMLSEYLATVGTSAGNGFTGVRSCVCSGEELDGDLARKFLTVTKGTGARLFNYYGPTEAAVDVTTLCVESQEQRVTLGRPAPNNRLYIVDDNGEPCPIGVTGELCIGGVQVARGYLNRPELNAERFDFDPFVPGERIYRTGDLARWLPNGEVLYVGRRDGQVKIRGYRVELGEIEQALRDQPGVERAVVLVQRDASGTDFLYAYLEGGPQCPSPGRLRDALVQRLPRYMVPSHYIRTEAIPVTRNGKADRRALARLAGAELATTEYVEASTETEQALVVIWKSLLPVERLGVTDDFFVIGGHSLLALQLTSRISDHFGVSVQAATVFTHRTIAEQARFIGDAAASGRTALETVARGERHVLSHAQERMWFLYMLDPESTAYHIRTLATFHGPLDVAVLQTALRALVARHEALRVTYDTADGQPFQRPRAELPPAFARVDLSSLGAEETEDAIVRTVREDDTVPFRLLEEAPLRFTLFKVGDTEHRLLTTLHHIAGDGWSLRLMMRELSILYTQHLGGVAEPLPELPVQYIDYAAAVRDPGHQKAIDGDLQYWLEQLAAGPTLELPTDVPGPDAGRRASGRAGLTLSADTGRKLRELAGRTTTTSFEVTMAALNLLLSRLSDQQDLVVGYPVANRQSVELEGIIGLFLNTLALRTDLSGDPSFIELLERVSTGIREAYAHQSAPFELLVERLNPVRQLDRTPVFNVLLNYLGSMREEAEIEGLTVEFDDQLFEPEAKFPLTFYVQDEDEGTGGEGLHIELVYRPDLFSAARAKTMLHQFGAVLEQVAEAPEHPLTAYSLALPGVADAEVGLATALDEPAQPPVTELIAARAVAAPDHVAITQGARFLSYGELVQRSEALARLLVARGCAPGQVVAVTGPRSIGFFVAMLGVLRSGATFFPLDQALPAGRRDHLLSVGGPTLFVCAEDPLTSAPDTGGVPTVLLDAHTGLLPTEPAAMDLPPVDPDSPAYLFFTSGTTGTPRGVVGRHVSLSHFLRWQSSTFGISTEDRCAQLTSASFDVMLRDTLLALVSGGTTVLPEPTDVVGGKAVFAWLERERVSVLHAAPTVLQSWLLDAPAAARLPELRLTFLAGEPLKAALVERFRTAFPDSGEIVNLYGPTETTMAKFAYRVPAAGPLPPVLPVGSPLPQCQAIVMRDGVVCGVGEPGEIVIRTPFRTLGYLGDPEANAAAFFPNPRRADERDLLYRTGDIGRLRPDGLLEIVGRGDHQIKISGVRIHPAEIENALVRHPLVSTCIVVAHKRPQDDYHLVAYVVTEAAAEGDGLAGHLRPYLTGQLPQAMVPAEFIALDRIPTNPNGKPDRAALPAPRFLQDVPVAAAEAPRTDTELRIRDAWQTALDRPVPSVKQDFFELGGTSLKVLRLYALLEEGFPGAFRVAQLFTHPTIALQAGLAEPTPTHHDHPEDEVSEHEF
ncbi:amino acid adenylation domain-containing protein [Streptomyces sp. NPDC059496]|uniref:amino acid adenylation domain-containing protein n=1 Tax=Streptomyces sp. NPDC059496 TaxID=3346851 RepID=UPI003697B877